MWNSRFFVWVNYVPKLWKNYYIIWCDIAIFTFSFLTWYVLSKLSYMNRVISDVFPTKTANKKRKNVGIQVWKDVGTFWNNKFECQSPSVKDHIAHDIFGFINSLRLYALPLCSPRNTSLNFLNGFPKSAIVLNVSRWPC